MKHNGKPQGNNIEHKR